jgi:hypothetical protein
MSLPREIDSTLVPRVSVATASKYIGRSARWTQRAIAEGRIRAIDTSPPGSKRPTWSIAVHHLREFLIRCELQAQRRLAEVNASEPNIGDMSDSRGG